MELPNLKKLSDEQLREKMVEFVTIAQEDRKQNQLLWYQPVSPKVQDFHNSTARVNALGGGNGCLPLDAPILMADGTWKQLGQIIIGDMVIASDPLTGKSEPAPVLRIFRSGKKPVYKIEFSDGGYFEATAEHQVPMYLGSGRTTSKGNLKEPHKRTLGDYIEPILRRGSKNPSKRISCVSPSDIQFINIEPFISPYLLGALLGDGSFSSGTKFHNADEDVINRIRLSADLEDCDLIKYAGNCEFGIKGRRHHYNPVTDKIKSVGLQGKTSYTKFIPKECFGWNRQQRLELLAGLIDTDGSLDEFSTCSDALAWGFEMLVRSLGGKATVNFRSSKCQNGVSVDSFRIYWRFNEKLPVSLKRKQGNNQQGKEIDYRRRICRTARLSRVVECGDIEVGHPSHCYVTRDFVIVSNSGKSDSSLVELIMCATGIFPESQRHLIDQKFRGPIQCRMVVESLTTTLETIILPKLQWWKWTGVDRQGGEKGHWGWIPKQCLIDGEWSKSYSQKLRVLTVICYDPYNPEKVLGQSTIQCMSFDQDPPDFASGDFHLILHDEPPSLAIWRENEARTMRVDGRMLLAMTWPDDPSINVDWLYNEVYEPGRLGNDPTIKWTELWTTENKNLKQEAVAAQQAKWSPEMAAVRIYGRPIRFSNRIHPEFTDNTKTWCFDCDKAIISVSQKCTECGSEDIIDYNHVQNFDIAHGWPTIYICDPHPRKPHYMIWVQINPSDDWLIVADAQVNGDCVDVRKKAEKIEEELGLWIVRRLIDPNMGLSPASSYRPQGKPLTWKDEFSSAGLEFDLADDSEVGRSRINTMLKPDRDSLSPRLIIHERCKDSIYQFMRYSWDNFSSKIDKDPKQTPKAKYDDAPACLKYLANSEPSFRFLKTGGQVIGRKSTRKGSY